MIGSKYVAIHKPLKRWLQNTDKIKELQEQGKTVVIIEVDKKQIGLIALSDTLKRRVKRSCSKTSCTRNIKVIMLTGDNYLAASYIAKLAGIDAVIAEVIPARKRGKIKELQDGGAIVAMVGDGINDAPALVQADVGIAMGTGTDVAIESAGITLLGGDVSKIAQAIKLSKMTMRGIKQNLFWAFIFNVVGIPLAAGLFYPAIWMVAKSSLCRTGYGIFKCVGSVELITN
jgi:Cu+-exporting ATPase